MWSGLRMHRLPVRDELGATLPDVSDGHPTTIVRAGWAFRTESRIHSSPVFDAWNLPDCRLSTFLLSMPCYPPPIPAASIPFRASDEAQQVHRDGRIPASCHVWAPRESLKPALLRHLGLPAFGVQTPACPNPVRRVLFSARRLHSRSSRPRDVSVLSLPSFVWHVCSYYIKATGILERYEHLPSFTGIRSDCQAIIDQLIQKMQACGLLPPHSLVCP